MYLVFIIILILNIKTCITIVLFAWLITISKTVGYICRTDLFYGFIFGF